MRKLPMLSPGEMDENQMRHVQFLVCMDAPEVLPHRDAQVAQCAAGCRTHIVFGKGYPDALPKVCGECSDWLMSCEIA